MYGRFLRSCVCEHTAHDRMLPERNAFARLDGHLASDETVYCYRARINPNVAIHRSIESDITTKNHQIPAYGASGKNMHFPCRNDKIPRNWRRNRDLSSDRTHIPLNTTEYVNGTSSYECVARNGTVENDFPSSYGHVATKSARERHLARTNVCICGNNFVLRDEHRLAHAKIGGKCGGRKTDENKKPCNE